MATVSLCMIVKNEEHHLPRCLSSVRGLMDELIIVDTGSTDRTREIATELGAKVFDFPWIDDFAAARNFSFSKATMDYCMWLDADDILTEKDAQDFLHLKEALPPQTDVVMMRYHTAFDDTGKPTFTYYRERLLRRAAGFLWEGTVHEAITPSGNILYSEVAVSHKKLGTGDPDRNLRIYENQLAAGKALSPRAQFYYARELMYHARYEEAAEEFTAFLDGGRGWVENNLEACRNLAYCEAQRQKPEQAFAALTRALRYAPPRAELCCDLGAFFFDRADWRTAAFWYENALSAQRSDTGGGFANPDCSGYIPCLQLCVCHYRLGNISLAAEYNTRAGKLKPDSAAYLYNKKFFEAIQA